MKHCNLLEFPAGNENKRELHSHRRAKGGVVKLQVDELGLRFTEYHICGKCIVMYVGRGGGARVRNTYLLTQHESILARHNSCCGQQQHLSIQASVIKNLSGRTEIIAPSTD